MMHIVQAIPQVAWVERGGCADQVERGGEILRAHVQGGQLKRRQLQNDAPLAQTWGKVA